MEKDKVINMGIGFATGRKNFRRVLNTYIYNWKECGLVDTAKVKLNVFIAYDLNYNKTKSADFTNISDDLRDQVDGIHFISKSYIHKEINELIKNNIIDEREAALFFGSGYAAMRNALLYAAMKNKMDYLLFLDDDEYPLAVTKTLNTALWSGQDVLSCHLSNIQNADITNGHHCGYISPIPHIHFNDMLSEDDFRLFIEAISNDIINWDSIIAIMNKGGVTYANTKVLTTDLPEEVQEVHHAKFISGANLCINLTDPERVSPFYNPPGARGEDTFLSTCLSDKKVLRVPCYTFHDGFSTYNHLLSGVLPIQLKHINVDSRQIVSRFYNASIGWTRYKPLLLYITQHENYDEKIAQMRDKLSVTINKICSYFDLKDFKKLEKELDFYHKNVKIHYDQFMETQAIWTKLKQYL